MARICPTPTKLRAVNRDSEFGVATVIAVPAHLRWSACAAPRRHGHARRPGMPPDRPGTPRESAHFSHLCPGMDASRTGQQEFLTIEEAAAIARVSAKRFRNLMAEGVLREGVHFTRPTGLRPRVLRSALLSWLQGEELQASRRLQSRPRRRARS